MVPHGFDKSADLLSKRQNHEEDFFKLSVLLKKSELYLISILLIQVCMKLLESYFLFGVQIQQVSYKIDSVCPFLLITKRLGTSGNGFPVASLFATP